jgi:hypothetical protein
MFMLPKIPITGATRCLGSDKFFVRLYLELEQYQINYVSVFTLINIGTRFILIRVKYDKFPCTKNHGLSP